MDTEEFKVEMLNGEIFVVEVDDSPLTVQIGERVCVVYDKTLCAWIRALTTKVRNLERVASIGMIR